MLCCESKDGGQKRRKESKAENDEDRDCAGESETKSLCIIETVLMLQLRLTGVDFGCCNASPT